MAAPRESAPTALVTGASSGLGAVAARGLARRGYRIVAVARNRQRLEQLRTDWPGDESSLLVLPADVTDQDATREVVDQAMEAFGAIDALVTCAGMSDAASTMSETASVHRFRAVLDVNITGTFLYSREVGAHMLERGSGAIVHMSSIAAAGGQEWGPLSYTASKAAVEGMTRQLAIEWADRGVRVNAIAPNHFMTRGNEKFLESDEFRGWVESRTPMRRIGRLEEYEKALVFLATDDSSYITGEVLHLDGGLTAARGTWQETPPWREPWIVRVT